MVARAAEARSDNHFLDQLGRLLVHSRPWRKSELWGALSPQVRVIAPAVAPSLRRVSTLSSGTKWKTGWMPNSLKSPVLP